MFVARCAAAALVLACGLAAVEPRGAQAATPDPPAPATPAAPSGETSPAEPAQSATPGGSVDAARPMAPQAQALYDRGLDLFRARDFVGAARVLEQGFAIEPRREFLFAEAQALRLAGDCARATPLYQRFIDSGAPPVQAQAARLGIDRCAPERAASAPAATPATTPASRIAAPPPTTDSRPPRSPGDAAAGMGAAARANEPSAWWRDPWVIASAGLGVAALGVGTAAFVASNQRASEAQSPRTTTERKFDQLWDQATIRREVSIVSLAVGVGLVAAGGARALWLHNRQPAAGGVSSLVFSCVPLVGGGTLSWEQRF